MCELSLGVHAKWARVGERVTNPERGSRGRRGGTLDADGTKSQLLVLGSRPGARSDQIRNSLESVSLPGADAHITVLCNICQPPGISY